MTAPTIEQASADAAATPTHTGGMVALIPSPEYAVELAVAGGQPAGELHLTLCYLGDDVTTWPPEVVDAVQRAALEITDPASAVEDGPVPAGATAGPLTLSVFAWSQFNPNGGPDGQEPCMAYQFSGDEDYGKTESLASLVQAAMKDAAGEAFFPEQYARFEPHVTAGYGLAPTALSYTGPVVFNRLRIALADQIIDLPLGGDGSMTAASLARTPDGSVTAKSRQKAKVAGHAMPDGSFPIENGEDLSRAIKLAGQAKDPVKTRKWIMSRARALKLAFKIPATWQNDGSIQASGAFAAASDAPDIPQPCEYSAHPAVRSLLFADGQRYVAVCDEHDSRAQNHIIASGGAVDGVVEITEFGDSTVH